MGRRRDRKGDAPVVEPLDVDGVRTLAIITVLWAVAFVVLAFQRAALNEADLGWWLWTCLAGVGLGLLGLEYCRKRRDAIAGEELREEADADPQGDWPDAGQAEGGAVAEPAWDDPLSQDPPQEPYPAAAQPLPERPVKADPPEQFGYGTGEPVEQFGYDTAEEVPPMPRPDDPYQHREGRPPPGYVTGDLPVVPPQPPEQPPPPGEPVPPEPAQGPATQPWQQQPWHEQPWPPPAAPEPEVPQDTQPPAQPAYPYDPAAPAGYTPEPDVSRRHPRDIEMARRREAEADHAAGASGAYHAPPEFLQDEPEPTGVVPEPPPEAPRPAGPPAEPDPVGESEFFSDLPTGGTAPDPAERAADEDPDLLLGDTPPAPGRRARPDSGRESSGEYRGRRARRD